VKEGILINAIAPSTMDTPANRQAMPKADHAGWPKVEDVAATVMFLASRTIASRAALWCPCMGMRSVCAPHRPMRR
jgi:NAD(P)-dependent dehydrogenase (short-subunit alcohol dehydrogenase family)